jgi:hypothetical protein
VPEGTHKGSGDQPKRGNDQDIGDFKQHGSPSFAICDGQTSAVSITSSRHDARFHS